MKKNISGFTLVELMIVIAVIGILVIISVASFNNIRSDSRDSQRSAAIQTLTEALEKYYDANGEYPSCTAMTQTSATVVSSTLVSLDPRTLTVPSDPAGTNSITCKCLTQPSGGSYISTCPSTSYISTDAYAYVGDTSSTCATGAYCTQYTLQYRSDSSQAIISQASRRTVSQ